MREQAPWELTMQMRLPEGRYVPAGHVTGDAEGEEELDADCVELGVRVPVCVAVLDGVAVLVGVPDLVAELVAVPVRVPDGVAVLVGEAVAADARAVSTAAASAHRAAAGRDTRRMAMPR
jgi:hypothetical protein